MITREDALTLLKQYNKEDFHIRHGLTVEAVMRYFAEKYGYDPEYWGLVGLLHDIDFEMYPEEHCQKAPELLKNAGLDDDFIRSFAVDELTGLIGAYALMRPSKSVQGMEINSLKKKFKDKKFAAGCSRDVIRQGAEMLGWELDELFGETICAMQQSEQQVNEYGV